MKQTGILRILSGIFFIGSCMSAHAQSKKGDFFGYVKTAVNFCQIDGDGASGYNKIGASAGYTVGQVMKVVREGNLSYIGGIEFSVRGSRRPFNPDIPAAASFRYVFQLLEVPVGILRTYKTYGISLGVRTTYLLKAEDKDNFVKDLQSSMSTVNMLGFAGVSKTIADHTRLFLECDYSINSITRSGGSGNPIFPTGVYHNDLSFGIQYQISGR